jgi:hypothetical protein
MKLLGTEVGGVKEVGKGHHHTAELRHGERLIHFMNEVAFEVLVPPPIYE